MSKLRLKNPMVLMALIGLDLMLVNPSTAKAGRRANQRACLAWCKTNRNCVKCSRLIGCGFGFKRMRSFKKRGLNWHACQKRGSASVNTVWPKNSAARRTHRALVVSLGGAFGRYKRDGIEWFCEDYLRSYKSRILCVGSFGSIFTRSKKLAKNIRYLAQAIRRKSGVRPKIILIGKSMGGCKLHHATRKMGGFPIDLLIGVDLSCSVACHARKGRKDSLSYKRNVKRIVNFFQMKRGQSQCGHPAVYDGQPIRRNFNINVNTDGFDPVRYRKVKGRRLCNNVGHKGKNGIDRCKGLKQLIRKLVLRKAGITR